MARVRTEQVYGPYYDATRRSPWAVHFIRADGGRRVVRVATEAEARRLVETGRYEAQGRTVTSAVEAYLEHKRASLRPASAATLEYRLRGILRTDERDRLLRDLSPRVASQLYARRVGETRADTHRGELAAAEAWAAWCIRQGWIRGNPFAAVEPVGQRATGKPQLRIDEARRFVRVALGEGTSEGLAAVMPVVLGMRASEVTDCRVRDIDDGAGLVWIGQAKTRAGVRQLIVPALLRPPLIDLVAGRDGGERLFGDVDRHWLGYHVRRLCALAGVPRVTPHGMRGLHASLATAGGTPVDQVARQLGHAGPAVTRRHYLAPGVEAEAGHERALVVLEGGKSR